MHPPTGKQQVTLCEELQVSDFFSHLQLEHLLQDVLSLVLLEDPHAFKLLVCESQQGSPCGGFKKWRERQVSNTLENGFHLDQKKLKVYNYVRLM